MFQASLNEQFSLQKQSKIVDPRTLDQLPHFVMRMPDRFPYSGHLWKTLLLSCRILLFSFGYAETVWNQSALTREQAQRRSHHSRQPCPPVDQSSSVDCSALAATKSFPSLLAFVAWKFQRAMTSLPE